MPTPAEGPGGAAQARDGERLDAEAVRELMFRYFHRMRSAIESHGGTVEKFVGDAVHAVFGVPLAHEDDATRAVRAAHGGAVQELSGNGGVPEALARLAARDLVRPAQALFADEAQSMAW